MTDVLAIDFGTSRIKAAYWDAQQGKGELLRLGYHDEVYAPSLFYLPRGDETIFWGHDAEEYMEEDPAGIVLALKSKLQSRRVNANQRRVSPQTLLKHLFAELRARAGAEVPAFKGQPPQRVRLTRPVLYSSAAEQVLEEAAREAGFTEVELIPEPVAAARAWLAETGEAIREVVVLDCGGGTLDWAYLRSRDKGFEPVPECPPGGDVNVGGQDVDQELLEHLLEKSEEAPAEESLAGYLDKVRMLKERHCRGLPLRPFRLGKRRVTLTGAEIEGVLEERYIRQTCEDLRRYLNQVRELTGGESPVVLLAGGSARIKGLQEALEKACEVQVLNWERAAFATVLGAVLDRQMVMPQREVERPKPGTVFRDRLRDGSEGPEMIVIPAGRFRMGDLQGDGYTDERPVHEVVIAEPFALGCYAVMFEEYDRFARATNRELPDDQGWGRGHRPVINVSWHDAVAYTEWLSEQTGQTYRLPSEAEWEYAARAGTETVYWWGNDVGVNRANCDGSGSAWSDQKTAPVGSFDPNPWGLYEVHGNVREWVADVWHENYAGAPADGSAWVTGGDSGQRVIRGGSWNGVPRGVRSAFRGRFTPDNRYFTVGFRLARTL